MKLIHKTISPVLNTFKSENYIVLDIETTGLGYKNKIILIGLYIIEDNQSQGTFLQFFNDDGLSEKEILLTFIEKIMLYNKFYFISFNGNAFDFSFLNARFTYNQINYQFSKYNNIDLLALARAHKLSYPFPSLSLKSIESFYSIPRKDTISGKESVELYNSYLLNQSKELERIILTHNEDDIINLWPLFCKMKDHLNISIPPCFLWNNQYYYIQAITAHENYITLKFSLPLFQELFEYFFNRLGLSFHTYEKNYELRLATKSILDKELYVFDTDKILGVDFDSLDNKTKQNYIVKYGDLLYVDNILNLVKTTLSESVF